MALNPRCSLLPTFVYFTRSQAATHVFSTFSVTSQLCGMDYNERGYLIEDCYIPRRWWGRLNWKKILFYLGIVFVLYDFSYCVIIYFYVKALNSDQDFRLQAYKTNYKFMKLYYTLHYYLGDPTLHGEDTTRLQEEEEL